MGAVRQYDFIVGPETSELPDIGVPTDDSDLISKGYADLHYVQGSASVANVTALAALDSSDRSTGDLVFVRAEKTLYHYDASASDSADGDLIVEPTDTTGRWFKVQIRPKATGSTASPTVITAVGGITPANAVDEIIFVKSDGGAVTISASPAIAAGSFVGQYLTLIGTDDTNSLQIQDGTGLNLNGAVIINNGQVLKLLWNGSAWLEIFRRV